MANRKPRPVFLNLLHIHQPVTAILSILHRISGFLLVVFIPALIYMFDLSLRGEQSHADMVAMLSSPVAKGVSVLLVWSLVHHLLAGLRFLLIDLDVGVDLRPARASAWAVNFAALVVAAAFLGVIL